MELGAATAADRRRHQRYAVFERARLRPNDWSTVPIEVRDISSHGFRAECDANIKIGGYVTIDVSGIGQVEAKVMWRRNAEIGAEFARPISLQYCGWLLDCEAAQKPAEMTALTEDTLIQLLAHRAARRATEH